MTNAIEFRAALILAIESRAAYESSKNVDNDSMQKTLSDIRKSVDHAAICDVLFASNCSADTINKSERTSNRFNVYAFEKIVNVARALASVATLNHYTLAIVKSAIALEKNEMLLTHKDAVSACSVDSKLTDAKREKILKSTRYAKHVALNTATTQSSSSINALQALNVLTESRDAANVVTYALNRESHATQALIAKLAQ